MPRVSRSSDPPVTLFPFLAVLLCLMGSLVFLLVALSAKVGVDPQTVAGVQPLPEPKPDSPPVIQYRTHIAEPVIWDGEVLPPLRTAAEVNAPTVAALARSREMVKRLRGEYADLRAERELRRSRRHQAVLAEAAQRDALAREVASMAAALEAAEAGAEELDTQLADLSSEISELKQDAHDAATAVIARPTEYRLIPTDRYSGTQRDPIVVECLAGGFRLGIEGVDIPAKSLIGRRIHDNPLTNAVNAMTVHYGASGKRPYVLLLVRPGGEVAFTIARALLTSGQKSWGYELLPDEMRLHWPDADDAAVAVARQAVERPAVNSASAGGSLIHPSGDPFGFVRNQNLRVSRLAGFTPTAGPRFGLTGRKLSGFEAISRGQFDRGRGTSHAAAAPVSDPQAARNGEPDSPFVPPPSPTAVDATGVAPSHQDGSRPVAEWPQESASITSELFGTAGGGPTSSQDAVGRPVDTGPHWTTTAPAETGSPASSSDRSATSAGEHVWRKRGAARRESEPESSTPDRSNGSKSPAGTRRVSTASSRTPRPVTPTRSASECLACRRKPWSGQAASGLVGFEKMIRVEVEADSLRCGDLHLQEAGTHNSRALSLLLTELTLLQMEEWGEPRAGMYWRPALIIAGSGPLAGRVQRAAKLADIPVRRRSTR